MVKSKVVQQVTSETLEHFRSQFMLKELPNTAVSMIAHDNGDVYIGQQIKDKKNGLGTMYYENGDVQISNWVDDTAHGCGVLQKKNGTNFVGKWRNGKLHWSKVQIQYPTGALYEGTMEKGEVTGKGTMHYSNGDIYQGEWKNGMWHGEGAIKYADGEIYVGEFHEDVRRGKGKCKWTSGLIYDGEWRDDTLHGNGVLNGREYDNRIHTGPWVYGLQQKEGMTFNLDNNIIKK
jgi:hypothetical protein